MARQQGWFALVIALAIAGWSVCISFPFQLGLDLKGGSQLTLEIQPTEEISKITPELVEAVKVVLDRRVNGLGVAESSIQTIGSDQLILELPGEQDPSTAARILGKTALLEFRAQKIGTNEPLRRLIDLRREFNSNFSISSNIDIKDVNYDSTYTEKINEFQNELGISSTTTDRFEEVVNIKKVLNEKITNLFEPTNLTGKDLITAGRRQEQNLSSWEVTLGFNKEGGEKFAELTKSIAGSNRLLGIILDGESISEASVGSQFKTAGISGGSATITGSFTAEEARELEVQLRGGSLPLPVRILQVRTIGPTLGTENIKRSLFSSLLGLFLVALIMLSIYRLPGFVAIIALLLYSLFNISFYALIPVTLTLPGIAGFILSIGMAVDANILIFERIKDELRRGNTLIRSIEAGFSQAFSSILDSHITTLISCIALFNFGTGFVKGFAATLGIGVTLSLFTALTCTRVLLKFLMSYQKLRNKTYFLKANQLPLANN
ncbi:protein translocase subunit SecD [Prochlorococcus sp. MIT 1223]|uniref:protein translocase subunit SecD n=1 Tax=Prochlorococcus sp. MIT 1223 TaxID=3096217 RepID=UPI002A7555F8|nr:protein translocase subunit SecD [Prochlorococcus sp. MIT 1223]